MVTMDYQKYLIKNPLPARSIVPGVKNRTSPALTYMSSALVPEAKYYIDFSWVWGIPDPNPSAMIHSHQYDSVILNIGSDWNNPEDLGAEIEYTIGSQILRTSTTGALFIPGGTPHGSVTWKEFHRPHVQISILLGIGSYQESGKESGKLAPGINYEKYMVRKPAYEVIVGTPVKNRQGPSSMTFMSNNLVPGSNIYIEGGWVFGMPDPNPHIFEHVHDYEEIVIHFGTDYKNPDELGGEIEFYVGGQPLIVDRTSAVFVPANVTHGPLIWKKYNAPHLEMAIMPGAGTLAEADPGGHQKKIAKRSN